MKKFLEKMIEDGVSTRKIMENKEFWDWEMVTPEDRDNFVDFDSECEYFKNPAKE